MVVTLYQTVTNLSSLRGKTIKTTGGYGQTEVDSVLLVVTMHVLRVTSWGQQKAPQAGGARDQFER